MRRIEWIVVHCSAVRPGETSSAKQIDEWHRQQGWAGIGYHFVVRRDGSIEQGRPLEKVGAHCRGYNATSVGVCYEGGLDASGKPADTRTEEQKAMLKVLVGVLRKRFPDAKVVGHHDLDNNKACPCFEVEREMW